MGPDSSAGPGSGICGEDVKSGLGGASDTILLPMADALILAGRPTAERATYLSSDHSMSDAYEELWRQNLPALRRNEIHPEPDPVPGDARWGVSALLGASISEPLRSVARAAQEIGQA